MKKYWWKVLAGLLLLYAIFGGFFIKVSFGGMEVAAESMRNIFYHVGMWFGMLTMLIMGFIYSLRYLQKFDELEDIRAVEAVNVGLMFGFLGIFTGNDMGQFYLGFPMGQRSEIERRRCWTADLSCLCNSPRIH